MSGVVMISGPIGAGKTAVCKALAERWTGPFARIEGDVFWTFLVRPIPGDRRRLLPIAMRSMTAAALPLARAGHDVLIDFSIPPAFLPMARRILAEVRLDFVLLHAPLEVCAVRARKREIGRIEHYDPGFHALFQAEPERTVDTAAAAPAALAEEILAGLAQDRFVAP